jgi:hypothetical protein
VPPRGYSLQAAPLPSNSCANNRKARTQQGNPAVLRMEQNRASPAGMHILHRSPQKLGTTCTAEQVPRDIISHMMFVKLAAVLGPPQHRRIHLLQCLQLCYMVHVKQGRKRLSPLDAELPNMVGNGPYWCCACRAWSCQQQDH